MKPTAPLLAAFAALGDAGSRGREQRVARTFCLLGDQAGAVL